MAPKGVSLILATYYAAGHSNVTNCAKKTCMQGISMHYIPDERNFVAEVDLVCPNSQERFKP